MWTKLDKVHAKGACRKKLDTDCASDCTRKALALENAVTRKMLTPEKCRHRKAMASRKCFH
jgi:hypothetical protein